MILTTHISSALRQLLKNKGRSLLTMLGIIIGIGSVIFILTIGESAKQFLLSQISQFGTNVIEVIPPSSIGPYGESDVHLVEEDVDLMLHSSLLPEVTNVAGGFSVIKTIDDKNQSKTVSLFGDRPAFFEVNHLKVLYGHAFTAADMQSASRVLVVQKQFAKDFFGHPDVVGERVKVGGAFFTIIGVVDDMNIGPGSFGPPIVFTPITTLRGLFIDSAATDELNFLLIEFESGANVDSLSHRIDYELRRSHNIVQKKSQPFVIISRTQALSIFQSVLLGIQSFVSAVAAISLLVGGIGIMNIMLVTVNERTKEIGLRKAIGAKNKSILTQFLIEAVVLTTIGGLIGILFGLGLSLLIVYIVNLLQPDWGVVFIFVPSALVIACGVSMAVGVIFGLYPAVKASRLQPIEALRYE